MSHLHTTLLTLFCATTLMAQEPTPQHPDLSPLWLKLSIHSQNAGHRLHDLGVDTESPHSAAFKKEIKAIDSLLDQLVTKGVLKKHHFKLKNQLDLEESLINAVGEFVKKASKKYGYYVVREMMDIGTRQRTKKFDDKAPVILNVRMPEKLLKEFEQLLHKNGLRVAEINKGP